MLGLISIQENGKMQSTRNLKQPLRLFLLAYACVPLVTSGATLLVLLITPRGLAAVGVKGGCSPWPLPIGTEPVTRCSLARGKGWSRRDV